MNALFESFCGTGRVLVMDDEKFICRVAETVLEALGYQVESVEEGASALRRYAEARTAGRPFDLVIMDLVIPNGLGGRETMPQLLQMDPAVKAIISSGYTSDPMMVDWWGHGFSGVIHKPYLLETFARTVSEVIRRPRGPARGVHAASTFASPPDHGFDPAMFGPGSGLKAARP